jgi:hypothetical protein
MQYMQGKGSGGMSVEETLTYDNERVFCTGNTLVLVMRNRVFFLHLVQLEAEQ